jgi:hypothetical protein
VGLKELIVAFDLAKRLNSFAQYGGQANGGALWIFRDSVEITFL